MRKSHVTDLAVKIDDNRVLRWASSENARNNFGNALLAELGLPMRNCKSKCVKIERSETSTDNHTTFGGCRRWPRFVHGLQEARSR